MLDKKDIETVRQSYGRILTSGGVMERFYEIFINSSPRVAHKFSKTDFDKQYEVLERSLAMALLFPQGNVIARQALGKIRESHSKENLNIDPALYQVWLDALVQTVSEHDPLFTPELDRQWRMVLQVTLDFIADGYSGDVEPTEEAAEYPLVPPT